MEPVSAHGDKLQTSWSSRLWLIPVLFLGAAWPAMGQEEAVGPAGFKGPPVSTPEGSTGTAQPVAAAPECGPAKRKEILTRDGQERVVIDCSITLPANRLIGKGVDFLGGRSDNVMFDCNGSLIRPVNMTDSPSLVVKSVARSDGTAIRAKSITIKNCRIKGAVEIQTAWISFKDNKKGEAISVPISRSRAPTGITLEGLTVENETRENTIYFHQGVTYSVLRNSRIVHRTRGVAMYLSAESAFNRIENNEFHVANIEGRRELMSIDSSAQNVIARNWFSGLSRGGIYLYRNCGESNTVRYTTPSKNEIRENIFYYRSYQGDKPAIYLGSRNGRGTKTYKCDIDAEWARRSTDPTINWGSSAHDLDYATHNIIRNNRFCNREPNERLIKTGNAVDSPNTIEGNVRIECPDSTPLPR